MHYITNNVCLAGLMFAAKQGAASVTFVALQIGPNNSTYWLSNSEGNADQARNVCSSISGALAIFGSNYEFMDASRILQNYFSSSQRRTCTVWIDIIFGVSKSASQFSWDYESVDSSLWQKGSPSSTCLASTATCCVEMQWSFVELADVPCNKSSLFLCKPWTTCQDNVVRCEQSCVDNDYGNYGCACYDGYILGEDGFSCEDVDECLSSPCSHVCTNTAGSYVCSCFNGSTLKNDKHSCTGFNECPGTNPCQQICTSTGRGYRCSCQDGFDLDSDSVSCVDVDECSRSKPCQQTCFNMPGSYMCGCECGYIVNKTKCQDVDECNDSSLCDQDCTNTQGSYHCTCRVGYTPASNGVSCDDVNECLANSTICDHICSNTAGSYRCSCSPGFMLNSDLRSCSLRGSSSLTTLKLSHQNCKDILGDVLCSCSTGYALASDNSSCLDINECELNNGNCQQICINEDGSYRCDCWDGYVAASDMTSCRKEDTCAGKGPACEQTCSGQNGSFSCQCYEGYTLDNDHMSCKDVDECVLPNKCEQNCINTNGSYECSCWGGYTLAPDNYSCYDENECLDDPMPCQDVCYNTPGSYFCGCWRGYTLAPDNHSCQDVDECDNNTQVCQQQCVNTPGSYECACSAGYTLDTDQASCTDVDECAEKGTACEHECVNTPGSCACACESGYALDDNRSSCVEIAPKNSPIQCSCSCAYRNPFSLSKLLSQIRDQLAVDEESVSHHRRKATSAPDSRASSKALAISSAVFISIILGLFAANDVLRLKIWLHERMKAGRQKISMERKDVTFPCYKYVECFFFFVSSACCKSISHPLAAEVFLSCRMAYLHGLSAWLSCPSVSQY